MGENISKSLSDKRLMPRKYEELLQTNNKKRNNPTKRGKNLKREWKIQKKI